MTEKTPSGISGLDKILNGGIPTTDLILLSGVCGAGKTTFGLQFLASGANKDPSVYISFEEPLSQIKEIAKTFNWPVEELEKKNTLKFLKYDPFKLEDIFEIIQSNIRDIKAKRIK